jgi:hypothetical protein
MKNKIYAVVVISFFIGLIIMVVNFYNRKYSIEKDGKIIIGKYVYRDKWGKVRSDYFIYNVDDKKYRASSGDSPAGFRENIGKFYKIKYLDKYPDVIYPLYDQEVTDTSEILKAGFSIDEVLNKRKNDLFPTTTKSE